MNKNRIQRNLTTICFIFLLFFTYQVSAAQSLSTKKNIIFDLGNVLIACDPNVVYKKYFANDLAKMNRFYKETGILEANKEMDRGRSVQEVLTELSDKFPCYYKPIHLWRTQWIKMISGPIKGSVKALESLHAQGYHLYALTNWSTETFFPYIRYSSNYKFLELFDDIVISGVEKITKPDPKIYKILLQRNRLDPKECIYIDDNSDNLIPAKGLGMLTIKFTSPEQLINKLAEFGVSVPIKT